MDAVAQTVDLLLTGRADATLNVETAFSDYLKKNPDADVKVKALSSEYSTSLITVSIRPASMLLNRESHSASKNSASTPSFSAIFSPSPTPISTAR